MEITIRETKKIEMSPELLARIFWEFDNFGQAEFFHHLAVIADDFLASQMYSVANETDTLSRKALYAMQLIGEQAIEKSKDQSEE